MRTPPYMTMRYAELSMPYIPAEFLLQVDDLAVLNLERFKSLLLDRTSPQGDEALRQAITNDLLQRQPNLRCHADWVVITTGSQQAIDVMMRVHSKNHPVVMEEPGYAHAFACAASAGHQVVTLPYDEHINIAWSDWERRLQTAGPDALVYLIPSFSNPLGHSFAKDERLRLKDLLKSHRGPVIEDGWMHELAFDAHISLPPLKEKNLIFIGSMTKKLFPGVRVGYIVIEDEILRKKFLAEKSLASGSGSLLAEKIVCEMLTSGLWSSHLKALTRKLEASFLEIKNTLEPVADVKPIGGGILCWVSNLKSGMTVEVLNQKLQTSGFSVRNPVMNCLDDKNRAAQTGFSLTYARCGAAACQALLAALSG